MFFFLLLTPSSLIFSQEIELELKTKEIDSFLFKTMLENKVPGVSYVIVRGDSIFHQKAFGYADDTGRKMDISTPVALPAVANSFTAIAILQLMEKRKLDLDDHVVEYFPWFRLKDKEASSKITIRNLLLQQSGINHLDGEVGFKKQDTSAQALENLVRELNTFSMESEPGTESVYANANFSILGALIEKISGQPFEKYIQEHIYDPLGMKDSFVNNFNPKSNTRATPHRYWFGQSTTYNPAPDRRGIPGSSNFISIRDAAKYMNALLQRDDRLLKRNSYTLIFDTATAAFPKGSAFGWGRDKENRTQFFASGWGEGHSASMFLFTEQKVGVAVLANSISGFALGNVWDLIYSPVSIIRGEKPDTDLPIINYVVYFGILLLPIIFCILIFILLRRYFLHRTIPKPALWNRILFLIGSILFAWFLLFNLPGIVSQVPLEVVFLYVPDIGWALLLGSLLCILWALLRIVIPNLANRKIDTRVTN